MSTPRQQRGILTDILARCANCGIKDHKTQMFLRTDPFDGDAPYPADNPDAWLCHVCGGPPPEGSDDDGQAQTVSDESQGVTGHDVDVPHGFQIGQENPSGLQPKPPRARRTSNSRRTPKNS